MKFNKEKVVSIINKMPNFLIIILMILVSPLGVYCLLVKKNTDKVQLYNKSKTLTGIALFILLLIGVGVYSKVKEIIVLRDSGMSFDMINFIPSNFWLYIIGIIMIISFLMGSKRLMDKAKQDQKYMKCVNIDGETSIKKISKYLSIPINEAKENIKLLQKFGYLVPIEIDNKKNIINYLEDNELKQKNKKIKCIKCGALITLKKDEYIECDFCGYGLIDSDRN